ncbi:MAG: zinc ribbon domain-containing protein [Clostridia bacterium]|nr:zinc ribbon domain-containing protein [Clostridia bacterium]
MKCPNCNYENLDSAKFCFSCGTPMETAPLTKYTVQLRHKMINCVRSPIFIIAMILFTVANVVQVVNGIENSEVYDFEVLDETFEDIGLELDFGVISRALKGASRSFVSVYDITTTVNTVDSVFKLLVVFSLWAVFFSSFTTNGDLKLAGIGLNIIKIGQIFVCVMNSIVAMMYFVICALALEGIESIYLSDDIYAVKETVLFWVFIAVTVTVIINVVFTVAVCKSLRAGIFVATTDYDADTSSALTFLCYVGGAFVIISSIFNIINIISGIAMILFGMINSKFNSIHITNW